MPHEASLFMSTAVTVSVRGFAGYWQARVLLLVCLVCILPTLVYLVKHPALLRRRVRWGPLAEREPTQKLIISLLLLCYFAMIAVSSLDHTRGSIHVPAVISLLGDLMVACGLILLFLTFRANPFAAATVQVESEQVVISTGPYALIRHPMYSGMLLLLLGIPPALGSWWGLVFFIPLLALIIWRLNDEEAHLSKRLPGYSAYRAKVRYRLIPRVW